MHSIEWQLHFMYHVKFKITCDCTTSILSPVYCCVLFFIRYYCSTAIVIYEFSNTSHSVTLKSAPPQNARAVLALSRFSVESLLQVLSNFPGEQLATLDEQLSIPELHTRRSYSVWLSSSRMMSLLSSPRPLRPMSTTPTGLFS